MIRPKCVITLRVVNGARMHAWQAKWFQTAPIVAIECYQGIQLSLPASTIAVFHHTDRAAYMGEQDPYPSLG